MLKVDLKYGFAPIGIFNSFGIFSWQAEYRVVPDGKFDFEYWDHAYEHNRASVTSSNGPNSTLIVTPKSNYLGEFGTMRGIYGRANLDVGEQLLIGATYQNMIGDKWNSENNAFETESLESFSASARITCSNCLI